MQVSTVAATTVTLTSAAMIAATVIAATATSTVVIVAFAALALIACAVSMASISAWIHDDSVDVDSYFNTLGKHIKYAIPAVAHFVAQTVLQTVIQMAAEGLGQRAKRWIGGPDVTIERTERRV